MLLNVFPIAAIHLRQPPRRDDLRESANERELLSFYFMFHEPFWNWMDSGEWLRICALNHLRRFFRLFIVSIDAIFTSSLDAHTTRETSEEGTKGKKKHWIKSSSHFKGNENDNELDEIVSVLRNMKSLHKLSEDFLFFFKLSFTNSQPREW